MPRSSFLKERPSFIIFNTNQPQSRFSVPIKIARNRGFNSTKILRSPRRDPDKVEVGPEKSIGLIEKHILWKLQGRYELGSNVLNEIILPVSVW